MKKLYKIIFYFILMFLALYAIKCQLRINIFDFYSLSNKFPFKYLQSVSTHIILNPKIGVLLEDSFEWPFLSKRNWGGLWAAENNKKATNWRINELADFRIDKREKQNRDKVVLKYSACVGLDSRCLVIKSVSAKSWAYRAFEAVAVKKGETYAYNAFILASGATTANIHVTTYDHALKVIKWNFARASTQPQQAFQTISHQITIPKDVRYIRFGISGSGKGNISIDRVSLKRMR
ncbi:MAG: hypothetical protein ACTSXG_03510 [Alphaproteobacteria bacterium]